MTRVCGGVLPATMPPMHHVWPLGQHQRQTVPHDFGRTSPTATCLAWVLTRLCPTGLPPPLPTLSEWRLRAGPRTGVHTAFLSGGGGGWQFF